MRSASGWVLWVGCALLAARPAPALDPAVPVWRNVQDVWSVDDGLPQGSVNALAQTPDGYLWVGTYDGLARFDGARFEVFRPGTTPGLRSAAVRAMLADRRGRLWIGTGGGGVSVREPDGGIHQLAGTAGWLVRALAEAADGTIWIGTSSRGLARSSPSGEVAVVARGELDSVTALLADPDGTLLVATDGHGLWRLDTRGGTPVRIDTGAANLVVSLLRDRRGDLWVGTAGSGLLHEVPGRFERVGAAELGSPTVSALAEDREGALWIATGSGGLVRRSGTRFERHSHATGLPHDVLSALLEDREGALWVGMATSGLLRLQGGSFATLGAADGLPDETVYSVAQGPAGTIWVATVGGTLAYRDGPRFSTLALHGVPALAERTPLRSLAFSPAGDLWIGTYGAGVLQRSGGVWRRYGEAQGLPNDNVRALMVDAAGTVWAATIRGLGRFRDGSWTTFDRRQGLPSASFISLARGAGGTIWFGMDGGGLGRLDADGSFHFLDHRDGLPSDVVLSLRLGRDGETLWIGTNGGLARLRKGRLTSWTSRDGLPSDNLAQLAEDKSGHLWVGTSSGIARIALADLRPGSPLQARVFSRGDGIVNSQSTAPSNGPLVATDGRLWFPTLGGLAVVDPSHLSVDDVPPIVHVERISADGVALPVTGALRIPRGTGRLEIQYTGICTRAGRLVRFRYRLAGFDRDWVDAGTRRTAFYTAVPPGDYRFEVIAENADGRQGTSALDFAIPKRLWEMTWFQIGAALLLALAVLAAMRARIRALKSRQRELETTVAARTAELRARNEMLVQRGAEVRASEERYHRLFADSLGLICTHTLEGDLLSINQAAARSIGAPAESLIGRNIGELLTEDARPFFAAYLATIAERGQAAGEMQLQTHDGERVWQYSNRLVADGDGSAYVVGHAIDVTERRRLEELMRDRALTDSLTGVANRAMFDDRLAQALARAARQERTTGGVEPLALVLLDLDDFKSTNDSLGHPVGDALLREIAARLASVLRRSDTVARFGGDEFAVILPSVGSRQRAEGVLRKLQAVLEPPLVLAGQQAIPIGVSLGMALYPEHGSSVEELLAQADAAMYAAKRAGKNQARMAGPSSDA